MEKARGKSKNSMKSRLIGSSIITLDSINSTNTYANQLSIEKKLVSGTVIIAHNQTAGKGMHGNKWESQEGKNLTFSILLFPEDLRADHQFMLSKVISLGIIDYLKPYGSGFSIKWPNDIYFIDRKIAGILIENSVQGSYLSESIIGIGLNINQQYFSKETNNPVSLSTIAHKQFNIEDELEKLLESLNKTYENLNQKKYLEINDHYLNNLYRFNQVENFTSEGEIFKGKIAGVTAFGQLQVELSDGTIKAFGFKEIEYML